MLIKSVHYQRVVNNRVRTVYCLNNNLWRLQCLKKSQKFYKEITDTLIRTVIGCQRQLFLNQAIIILVGLEKKKWLDSIDFCLEWTSLCAPSSIVIKVFSLTEKHGSQGTSITYVLYSWPLYVHINFFCQRSIWMLYFSQNSEPHFA